jgi:cobalt-zinc-cadmium efflux system outer membrane protein
VNPVAFTQKTPRLRRGAPKTLVLLQRALVWGLVALGLASPFVVAPVTIAQTELTEADVIRLAHATPELAAQAAQIDVHRAREVAAGLYPNPRLFWDREHIPGGDAPEAEDAFGLEIPLDLSGRPGARAALARSATAAAASGVALDRAAVAHESLLLFYDAIGASRRAGIADAQVERLGRAVDVLARRQAEGTAAGGEEARLRLETELGRSRLAEARADAAIALGELAARLGLDPATLTLRDDIDVHAAPAAERERASVALARTALEEAHRARDRSAWAWVPALGLHGGALLRSELDGMRAGYVAGISLEVPIFSRGQELGAEAESTSALREAELDARRRANRVAIARASTAFEAAHRELRRFDGATREALARLVTSAHTGYREGHTSLLELVDAERARYEVEERRLALELAAKRAELALRRARGELE